MSHVLLVEDDPIVRQAYSKVLRSGGHALETACDGVEALEKVRRGDFDAVVSDINMPRLSGIELLQRLRDLALDVPVVLVTGGPALESAVRAVEYGAFRYLTKPVDIDALLETVTRAAREGSERRRRPAPAPPPAALDDALASLWMAFQPIVSWSARRLYGFEALVRSESAVLPDPGALLDAAERSGRLRELGRSIRARVAAALPAPEGAAVFVNLHASDLDDEALYDPAAPLSAHARRVVLEITERAALGSVDALPERLGTLRRLGYRIAVDDLGAGYAGLASFPALQPEVVKIDMTLVRGIDASPLKQRVVRSVAELGRELGTLVVSEGIETAAERDALAGLGCDLFQGYLFARPARDFSVPTI
jgi:EAL domain-containing protein (putative c-di-GMP-specific phosphodiesterase class I)